MTDYMIIKKRDSWIMQVLGILLGSWFMHDAVTTIKWPFCDTAYIYTPNGTISQRTLEHEAYHVAQFRKYGFFLMALAYVLLPLPLLLSGRWFIERRAYLNDIEKGYTTINRAVSTLHNHYFYPWPASWMERWFTAQVMKGVRSAVKDFVRGRVGK